MAKVNPSFIASHNEAKNKNQLGASCYRYKLPLCVLRKNVNNWYLVFQIECGSLFTYFLKIARVSNLS